MYKTIEVDFINQLYHEKNVLNKTDEDLERELNEKVDKYLLENPNYEYKPYIIEEKEEGKIYEHFDGFKYKCINGEWENLYDSEEEKKKTIREYVESLKRISKDKSSTFRTYKIEPVKTIPVLNEYVIKSPKELKGMSFYTRKDGDLTLYIEDEVKDPFQYIKIDDFYNLGKQEMNNIIVTLAYIDFLNEKFKSETDKYKKKYHVVRKRIKKWFIELDGFDKNFENEVNKLNKSGDILNKKDEETSNELVIKYNNMNEVFLYYQKIKNNLFIKNLPESITNSYLELLDKTIYTVKVDEIEYKLRPNIINDREGEFEIVSPKKYKGSYIYLKFIPVFVLSFTTIRPYFDNGKLTEYGRFELEMSLKHKVFYKKERGYSSFLIDKTGYKVSDFDRFKELYQKIFESDNNFKLKNPSEREKSYIYVISEFYKKYADIVAREYRDYLYKDYPNRFSTSFNVSEKVVYNDNNETFFDQFTDFFISRLVKQYSPLNKLPKAKGSFSIEGNVMDVE